VILTLFAILAGFFEAVSAFLVSGFFSGFFTSLALSAFGFSDEALLDAGFAAGVLGLAGVPLAGADLFASAFVVSALPVSFGDLIGGFFSVTLAEAFSAGLSAALPGALEGFSGADSFGASFGFEDDFESADFLVDATDLESNSETEDSDL
jgi:hypothetical protein